MTKSAALKLLARRGLAALTLATGAPLAALRGKTCIIAYHRVLRREEVRGRLLQPGMYVLDEVFDMHLGYLKRHFDIVPIAELLRIWESGGGDRGARYCAITFDDGWRDNYRNAFPILKRHGVPATVFLTTAAIGTTHEFWPEKLGRLLEHFVLRGGMVPVPPPDDQTAILLAGEIRKLLQPHEPRLDGELFEGLIGDLKRYPEDLLENALDGLSRNAGVAASTERAFLDWDEVREMSAQGMTFGSHGSRHRIMTRLTASELDEELSASRDALRRPGMAAIPVLAYPNGNWSPAVARAAQAAGYRAAVTTRFGHEGLSPEDLFGLKRVCLHNDVVSTAPLFATRIAGVFPQRRPGGV